MEKVKLLQFETTNQRILNEENTKTVCAKLRSGKINKFAWLKLHLMFFVPSNMPSGTHASKIMFFKKDSKITFMKILDAIERDTFENNREAMFPSMI